jgi:hypothetical protein
MSRHHLSEFDKLFDKDPPSISNLINPDIFACELFLDEKWNGP